MEKELSDFLLSLSEEHLQKPTNLLKHRVSNFLQGKYAFLNPPTVVKEKHPHSILLPSQCLTGVLFGWPITFILLYIKHAVVQPLLTKTQP